MSEPLRCRQPQSRHRLRAPHALSAAGLRRGRAPDPGPQAAAGPRRGAPTRHPPPRRWPSPSGRARQGRHEGLLHGDAARGAPRTPRPSQGPASPHLHARVPAGLHLRRARPQQDQGTSPAGCLQPLPSGLGGRERGAGRGRPLPSPGSVGYPTASPLLEDGVPGGGAARPGWPWG